MKFYGRLMFLLAFVVIVVTLSISKKINACSLPQAKYVLVINDSQKRLPANLLIKVVDSAGQPSYCYPISNYNNEQIILFDKNNSAELYHISLSPEYSSTEYSILNQFVIWKTSQYLEYRIIISDADNNLHASIDYRELLAITPSHGELVESRIFLSCHSMRLPSHLNFTNRKLPEFLFFPVVKVPVDID